MDRQREAIKLQKEGNFLDALSLLEQELLLTQQQYGENSPAFQKLGERVAELCNQLAMNCLVNEKMSQALDLLKRAQILSAKTPHLKAITYNNIACFYRRQGKLRVAMNYLHKALAIDTSPDIYLNLCAVLSQSGKHDHALEQVMHAVILLQETLMEASPAQHREVYALKAPVLAIAYHNLAVELEHMKRLPESLRYYTKAVEFARKHLPDDHTVMTALLEAQISANRQAKTRISKGRKMPPIRGNYRIVFKEGKDARDGKGPRSPSPFLRGQAGRHARSKSPDFRGKPYSISPMRNNFFEQTAAYTERLRKGEVIHADADMRQITSEYSNSSTPMLLKDRDRNSKSVSQPLRNIRRSELAELRHSIQAAEDIVHISSASRPMLEISLGKVLAIQVNRKKNSSVFSAETLSIEPVRRSSDSEPSAVSKKKNYTRDALDIINQFGISIYSQEASGKVSQLLSDGAAKPASQKASNPNIVNATLDQRYSLKERIASLKSLNSSHNPSVKTDRSIKLPPLPNEDVDPLNTSGKAPSQISRVSLDNSSSSIKVFRRSIRRSNRNSIGNTPSHQETTDLKVFETRRESYRYRDTDKDIESREEDISNVEDLGKRRGDEEENVEEDEIEKIDGVGSMRMNIIYDDAKLVRRESVFELEIGKENRRASASSEEFEPDQVFGDTEMSLEQGKEVIVEQAEQEDVEISHEQEDVEINQEQEDEEINHEQEDKDINHEQEDIDINHEQDDKDINHEQEDVEINHEQEDKDISRLKEDTKISIHKDDIEISPEQSMPEMQEMNTIEIERETEEQVIPQDEYNGSIHIDSTLSQSDEVHPDEPIPDTEYITSSHQDPEVILQEEALDSPSNLFLHNQLHLNQEEVMEPDIPKNQHELSTHEAIIQECPDAVAVMHESCEYLEGSVMNEGCVDLSEEDEITIRDEEVEQDLAQIQQEEEGNLSSHEEYLELPGKSKLDCSIQDEPGVGDQVNLSDREAEAQTEEALINQEAAEIQAQNEEVIAIQEPYEAEVQHEEVLAIEEPAEVEVEVQPEEVIVIQTPAESESEVQHEGAVDNQEPAEAEIEVEREEAMITQVPAEVEIEVYPEEVMAIQEPAEIEAQQEEALITQEPAEAEIEVEQEEALITQEPAEAEIKVQEEEAISIQEPAEAEIEVEQEEVIEIQDPFETEVEQEEVIPIQEPIQTEVQEEEAIPIQEPPKNEVQQEEVIEIQDPVETEVQEEEVIEIQESVQTEVQEEEAIPIQEPPKNEVQQEEVIPIQEPAEFELQQEPSAVNETEQDDSKEDPQIDLSPLEVSTSPNLALSPPDLPPDLPADSTQQPKFHPQLSSQSFILPHVQEIAREESWSPQDNLEFLEESATQPSDLKEFSPLPSSCPNFKSSKLVDPEKPTESTLPG